MRWASCIQVEHPKWGNAFHGVGRHNTAQIQAYHDWQFWEYELGCVVIIHYEYEE